MQNWYDLDFEEYIRQGEPDKKQRTYDWQTAIGLQAVDGLTPSDYLIQTAKKNIEGDITIQEVKSLINTYYESRTERNESGDDRTEEADKVSVRIAEILGELAFNFSIIELKNIHKRLFTGIFNHAGEFRDYNITKKEWVLKGDTVIYTTADILQETLTYDFEQEKKFSYDGLSADDFIKHICRFVSGIWQIHPFGEGNTRTTSVFTIKYLRTLGFNVTNDAFSKNSWYFRNALVRANYTNVSKGIKPAPEFLEAFFRNLLLGEENELKNRYMHLDAPSISAKLALWDDSKGSNWHFGESQQANLSYSNNPNRTNLPIRKLHKCTLEELAVFNAIKENHLMDLNSITNSLREGTEKLVLQTAAEKNAALQSVVASIEKNRKSILDANAIDVKKARDGGMTESLVDRLSLNDKKIDGIIESINQVIAQTDPIGEEVAGWKTPNGLTIRQVRVPIGVVAIIYESRPNVTADAFCLAYKSGNAILLRGSSSALNSNRAIVAAIKEGLGCPQIACADNKSNSPSIGVACADGNATVGVPESIELAPCESHDEVEEILTAVGKIDMALPRGGAKLIKMVVEKAKVPVIETGSGVCHLYVDDTADLEMATKIAVNGKMQRPGVCNALECIVVNKKIASEFLPKLADAFSGKVVMHADEESYKILSNCNPSDWLIPATPEDFGFEFLDFACAIKTVDSIDEAITYINSHNTKHSESIITNDRAKARLFQNRIDASCVYVNASTRFTDGGEFGFGAELGISTQKLHARGPMGIKALTTTKYLIDGDGQVR